MIEYLKNELKHLPFVFGVLILLYGLTTLATTTVLNASDVTYNNQSSSLLSSNVQDAIDEVYQHTTDYNSVDDRMTAVETKIGNTALNTTAQTLTGAINELAAPATTNSVGNTALTNDLTNTSEVMAPTPYALKQVKTLVDQVSDQLGPLVYTQPGTSTISTSRTYTVPSSSRHLLVLSSASNNYRAMYTIYVTNAGIVAVATIYQGSGVSYTTGTNSLTITGSGSGSTQITLHDFSFGTGSITG